MNHSTENNQIEEKKALINQSFQQVKTFKLIAFVIKWLKVYVKYLIWKLLICALMKWDLF